MGRQRKCYFQVAYKFSQNVKLTISERTKKKLKIPFSRNGIFVQSGVKWGETSEGCLVRIPHMCVLQTGGYGLSITLNYLELH